VNKRKAKKLHIGPYKETGVRMIAKCNPPVEAEKWDAWVDTFITNLEKAQLFCGGGMDTSGFDLVIEAGRHKQINKAQIEKARAIAKSMPNIAEVSISEPIDLYYGKIWR